MVFSGQSLIGGQDDASGTVVRASDLLAERGNQVDLSRGDYHRGSSTANEDN
jgi:hypothetical protein